MRQDGDNFEGYFSYDMTGRFMFLKSYIQIYF